jgi:tetratricopeptide (TPR) repeat protein
MNRTVKWSKRHQAAVVAGAIALILTLTTSTVVLSKSLHAQKIALTQQQLAIQIALGSLDQITRPLILDGAGVQNQKTETQRVLSIALSFYDRIPTWFVGDNLMNEGVAKAYRQAGFCRMALGSPKCRQNYRQAISNYESLASGKPEFIYLQTGLIETLHEYSRLLTAPEDQVEAEASFRRALAVGESLIGNPEAAKHCYTMGLVGPLNDLAWALVRRPLVSFSDAQVAIRLSRKTVDWEPTRSGFWNTLGVAYYRLGDWSSAASALQKSMDLNNGGDAADWFFLAAVDQHLGKPQQARQRFDQAVSWMERNPDRVQGREAELNQFRKETAMLLSK